MARVRSLLLSFVLITLIASPVRSAEPVQVNVILPLTGSGALLGQGARTGLQLLEKRVNASGGIRGQQMQFVIADDQSSPQVAVQIANQLIAKNVPVILGSSLVGLCGAIVPLLKNGPVLYCFSPGIHPQAGSFAFTAGIASADLMAAQIHFLHERNVKRLAWIGTTDASGQDGEAALDAAAALPANAGMTVVDREHFNITDLSIEAQMARIKAANADAIVSWASGTPMATVVRGISDAGLDKPLLVSAANLGYTALKQYAPTLPANSFTAANAVFSVESVTDQPVKRALLDMGSAFTAAGLRPDFLAAIAWDPGFIVVSALRKLGPDATAEQIRAYIAGLRGFVGTNGRYDFTKVPQRGLGAENSYVVRWDGPGDRFIPVSRGGGIPLR
jgi:branched-chain amino acid transport system substrate-binding protein